MQIVVSKRLSTYQHYKDQFSMEDYSSLDKPTFFVGMFSKSDIAKASLHKGKKIIMFGGSDTMSKVNLEKIKSDKNFDDAVFISRGPWMKKDLDEVGIPHTEIVLMAKSPNMFMSQPLGDSLYWYGGNTSKHGKRYLAEVRKAIPDLDIIITDHHLAIPHEEMPQIYTKCFASIRPLDHDAFGQTVWEAGLMGRKTIYNGTKTSFTVPFKDVDDIIRIIKDIRNNKNRRNNRPKVVSTRCWAFYRENYTKWANLIFDLFGTDELDAAKIFHEIGGQCGSIFRIQRKSDIEKIGGLGKDQFERPWFEKEMSKLGKKKLIVSKASQLTVTEWKNDGNKGYGEFNDYVTKYQKKEFKKFRKDFLCNQ